MKAKAALFAFLLSVSLVGRATTFSTDMSDLWFNANESGWGINIIHQDDTLFATMFVYGANSQPAWYVASDVRFQGASNGNVVFSGALFSTGGSYFANPWNPAAFNFRQVGTITFTNTSISTATISYTVDGASVTKNVVRQTWKVNNLSGGYMGGQVGTYSACTNPSFNGYREEAGLVSVNHVGTSFSMEAPPSGGGGGLCTYSGTYAQRGRMGEVNGTFNCTNGLTGTFSAFEVEANITGLTARVVAQSNACRWDGRVGGLRRNNN